MDAADQYQCSNYAEEDIENVEHIYLMYQVFQNTDEIELRCDVGVGVPKLVIVCQYRFSFVPVDDFAEKWLFDAGDRLESGTEIL